MAKFRFMRESLAHERPETLCINSFEELFALLQNRFPRLEDEDQLRFFDMSKHVLYQPQQMEQFAVCISPPSGMPVIGHTDKILEKY